MDRRDRALGSHDRGRAQITQISAHTGGTLTRQPAAPNGGSVSVLPRPSKSLSVRHVSVMGSCS